MIDLSQNIFTAAVFNERYTNVILHFTFPSLFPTKIVQYVLSVRVCSSFYVSLRWLKKHAVK